MYKRQVFSHRSCVSFSITKGKNDIPQTARDRVLKIIADKPVIMINGDQNLGIITKHSITAWDDGPYSYALPALSDQAYTRTNLDKTYYTDLLGRKTTIHTPACRSNGFRIITFDPQSKSIEMDLTPLNNNLAPKDGWPFKTSFE